jgi:hypothetical protein
MIGEPLFISFINLEMKKLTHTRRLPIFFTKRKGKKERNHLDTSAEESVRSLILRIAFAAAS